MRIRLGFPNVRSEYPFSSGVENCPDNPQSYNHHNCGTYDGLSQMYATGVRTLP